MYELERTKSIRTGIFVLVGLLIFFVGFFYVGRLDGVLGRSTRLYATFREVNGLQSGNDVWLSGVKVGTVRDVSLATDTSVSVTIEIRSRQQAFIKRDGSAYISSDGIIGNKLLMIVPGHSTTPMEDGAMLSVAATLYGDGLRITALLCFLSFLEAKARLLFAD